MPAFLFFPFYGPGYRSERKVIELRIDCSGDPGDTLPRPPTAILAELRAAGAADRHHAPDLRSLPRASEDALATLVGRLASWLQRRCGHAVEQVEVIEGAKPRCRVVLVEHDDPQVGMAAMRWATALAVGTARFGAVEWRGFAASAAASAQGMETRALVGALERRGIPFLQAEREPLADHFRVEPRVRRNGLLVAGQGCHLRVLDGSFCHGQAGPARHALLHDASLRQRRLHELALAVPAAPDAALHRFELLWVAGRLWAMALKANGGRKPVVAPDAGWAALAQRLAEFLDARLLGLQLAATSLDVPPPAAKASVLDFDLAPDLAAWADAGQHGSGRLAEIADHWLAQLFPPGSNGRIPLVCVTGTNGKTTTSRMVAQLLRAAGLHPALVCTDGIFIDGREISRGDAGAFIGHARALANPSVRSAVLETHHRGIAVRGFAFDRCDVGVVLNVTPDHLVPGEIETLEEMVRIKQAVAERASGGVVLNAQDPACLGMLAAVRAPRVVLFASQPGHPVARGIPGRELTRCVVEIRDGVEWVVLDGPAGRDEVVRVDELPATLGGAARFNLENALAAIGCGHLLGLPPATLRAAMRGFEMSHAHTPGRLNCYRHRGAQVVVDYAHNVDGIRRLSEFAQRLPVAGRRLLLLAAPGDRTDAAIADLARAAAGSFDHYLCRSYPNLRGRASAQVVPGLLSAALLDAGVPSGSVEREPDAIAAIHRVLAMATPGDLVVLQLSSREFDDVHALLAHPAGRQGGDARG